MQDRTHTGVPYRLPVDAVLISFPAHALATCLPSLRNLVAPNQFALKWID